MCEREGVGETDREVRGDGLSRVLVKDVRLEGRGTSVWNLRMASVTYGINFCSREGYTSVFILLQNSLDWDSHHCCQGWIASESSHRRNCTVPSF